MADVTYALVRRNPQGGGLTAQARRLEVSTAVTHPWRWLPLRGTGILAGQFPDGLTTIEGEPTTATVRVLYRPEPGTPGDGVVVAEVQSNQDGTWLVEGLNPELTYDVVGRKDGFNDVIMSRVRPYSSDFIHLSGSFTVVKPERNALEGRISVTGGTAPYTVDVVAGAAPAGIAFSYFFGAVEAAGTTEEWGEFEFTLRVTDANGVWAEIEVELTGASGLWGGILALMHFDGDLIDRTGREWQSVGSSIPSDEEAALGIGSLKVPTVSGQVRTLDSPSLDLGAEDFTVEFFIRPTAVTNNAVYISKRAAGSFYAPICIQRQSSQNVLAFRAAFAPGSWGVNLTTAHPALNTWTHLAFVREGAQFRAYVGGVRVGQVSPGTMPLMTNEASLNIAADGDNAHGMVGYLDELRITKGIARYTENFTPPTAPF